MYVCEWCMCVCVCVMVCLCERYRCVRDIVCVCVCLRVCGSGVRLPA